MKDQVSFSFQEILEEYSVIPMFQSLILILIGYFLAKYIKNISKKIFLKKLSPHHAMLISHFLFYFIFILFLISAIQQLGFSVATLLGATGIITVAVGIASQTSMSNILSGLFLIGERPFEIGSNIKINDVQGDVVSIDYFSIKIRTAENILVRIPNEMMMKSTILNYSSYPIRRIDIKVNIAYQISLDDIQKILMNVIDKEKSILSEPKAEIVIVEFSNHGAIVQFSFWIEQEKYLAMLNSIKKEIYNIIYYSGIEMNNLKFETKKPLLVQLITNENDPIK